MSLHHQEVQPGVPKVTELLAEWVVNISGKDIPADVRKEGVRTFVNWVGCAVGGASHETVDCAIAAVLPFSGKPTSTVLGRSEKVDALHAALLNGISSHVLDFDDTHLKTIIHPAGPVASALLALAEMRPMSGYDFITAMIVGIEVECRIGNAVYPEHYDRGWHITGTVGVFGAAAAIGKIIGLSKQQMCWAFGLAATQSSSLREMFGTMTKSFHPGRAAQNGMMSALLAEANFDSSQKAIEAPRGFANVMSDKQDYSEILDDLGTRWESALNSYKPFACGIVIHPAIDGCIQLRNEIGDKVNEIQSVALGVIPWFLSLPASARRKPALRASSVSFTRLPAPCCAAMVLRLPLPMKLLTCLKSPRCVTRLPLPSFRAVMKRRSKSRSRWKMVRSSSNMLSGRLAAWKCRLRPSRSITNL